MTAKPNLPEYIEPPIREKLEEAIEAVAPHLPEPPEECFVSTQATEPRVPSIWLFTKHLLVEIRLPLSKERVQFDFARLHRSVDWIRLNARRYDFAHAVDDSVLELEFTTTDGTNSELSATGEGCTRLMEVYRERILRNFKTSGDCPDEHEETNSS